MENVSALALPSSSRARVLILVSLLGAGALLCLTATVAWNNRKKKGKKDEKVHGVSLNLIKEEMARRRPKVTKGQGVTKVPHALAVVQNNIRKPIHDTSSFPNDSSSSSGFVSSLIDLAVNDADSDIQILKAMSDLDAAINQLEEVMVTLNVSKEAIFKNGGNATLSIQSEINKLRYLLELTSSAEFQSLQFEKPNFSTLTDSQQEVVSALSQTSDILFQQDEDTLVDEDVQSESSDASFVSAAESLGATEEYEVSEIIVSDYEFESEVLELKEKNSDLNLYMCGIEHFCQNGVPVRRVRKDMVDCDSDIDFIIKVHCLRQGFQALLESEKMRMWFVKIGKELIGALLTKMDRDFLAFDKDLDSLVDYCEQEENWAEIEEELAGRGVCSMSFYDIVLDFIVMDAFEDLDNPPYTVTTAVQNRWLSTRIKETALTTAVWSIIKAKKQMLSNPNGFLGKMYDVSQHVTPMLAWGFLGPVEDVRKVCQEFKNSMVGFLQDIFSTTTVSYSSVRQLADDIQKVAESRRSEVSGKLL